MARGRATAPPGGRRRPAVPGLGGPRTVRKRSITSRWSLTHEPRETGDRLTWLVTTLDGPWAGRTNSYYRFDLSDAPGGAEIEFTRTYQLLGALLAPVSRRLATLGVPSVVQNILNVVANTTEQTP